MIPEEFACPEGTLYQIQPGDTLFSLSRRFGVPLERILAANPRIDPLRLRIGQIICIPAQFAMGCPGFIHRIGPGETLFALAGRFGTTVQDILSFNPGLDPNNLFVGQLICIPVVGPGCPAGTATYIVRPGDTFFALARRFGTTPEAIARANPGVDPQNLVIGQRLCIPV